jgi:hypothetical protein
MTAFVSAELRQNCGDHSKQGGDADRQCWRVDSQGWRDLESQMDQDPSPWGAEWAHL